MDYVDANILIYAISDNTTKGEKSRKLLLEENLVTCTLTLNEVGYYYYKRDAPNAVANLKNLAAAPNLRFVPFGILEFPTFFGYMEKGLAPRDAIHATIALQQKSKIVYSEDKNWDAVKSFKRKTPW